MTKLTMMTPIAIVAPSCTSRLMPVRPSEAKVPARMRPARRPWGRRARRRAGGGPRVVALLHLLTQAGGHEDVVVGADRDHEHVQQHRQDEEQPRLGAEALEEGDAGAEGGDEAERHRTEQVEGRDHATQ